MNFFSKSIIILLFFSVVISHDVTADDHFYDLSGKIEEIMTIADDLNGGNKDFLMVKDEDSAGNCRKYASHDNTSLVLVRLTDKERIYSVALAAKMSGSTVDISLDDRRVDADGYCIIRSIRIK
ncbi:MAG: hypothetical protein AAGB12_16285 [Pseudomonadota bacterium]